MQNSIEMLSFRCAISLARYTMKNVRENREEHEELRAQNDKKARVLTRDMLQNENKKRYIVTAEATRFFVYSQSVRSRGLGLSLN